jgi:hypothetical protein
MKIAIADNQNLRFDNDLKEHWEKKHEVRYEPGASEHLFQWCDLYYINYWDNNIHYLYNWHIKHPDVKKPKIVCRAIDWEVWTGLVRDQSIVNWVDVALCITKHIKERLEAEVDFKGKLHLVKPGINISKYSMVKENQFTIIMPVNEFDWYLKHTIEGLKIFKTLLDHDPSIPWKLHIRGKWCQAEYFQVVIKDFVKKAQLTDHVVFDEEWVDDFNAYLNKFDFMLLPSLKEAFSFVTAQCAVKGIRPILNWWYGAENIYPKNWLYLTEKQAVEMFFNRHKPAVYRAYIEGNYTLDRFLKETDEACGT